MEIFSKVHYQPRLLTRSSWWITLMLLLACSTTLGASSDVDFDQWMDEYDATKDKEKETWVKTKLEILLDYDELFGKYEEMKQEGKLNGFVLMVLNQYADYFNLRFDDRDKMISNVTAQNKKGFNLNIFKKFLNETGPYNKIINKWKLAPVEEIKKTTLREVFQKLNDVKEGYAQFYSTNDSDNATDWYPGCIKSTDVDINGWMKIYPKLKNWKKEDWIKGKFKILLDYNELNYRYGKAEDRDEFVSCVLNQYASDFNLALEDREKIKYNVTAHKNKISKFREIVKETVPYNKYIKDWKDASNEHDKKHILSEGFQKFIFAKERYDCRIGLRYTFGDPDKEEPASPINDEKSSSSPPVGASPVLPQDSQPDSKDAVTAEPDPAELARIQDEKLAKLQNEWQETFLVGYLDPMNRTAYFKLMLKKFVGYHENFLKPYTKLKTNEEKVEFVKRKVEVAKKICRRDLREDFKKGELTEDEFDEDKTIMNERYDGYVDKYEALSIGKERDEYFKKIVKEDLTVYGNALDGYKSIGNDVDDINPLTRYEKKYYLRSQYMVELFTDFWKNQQKPENGGIADRWQQVRPGDEDSDDGLPAREELTDAQKEELLKQGYDEGFEAGRRGPESRKALVMNALYNRFRDWHAPLESFVASGGTKYTHSSLPQLDHSRCEQCNEKLRSLDITSGIFLKTLWKKATRKSDDCKMCGRLLCDDCADVRDLRTCKDLKDPEGCFCGKQTEVEIYECPSVGTPEEDDYYQDSYKHGYNRGETERKATSIYKIKILLYERFRDFAKYWKVQEDGSGEVCMKLKLNHNRCEIAECGSKDGLQWKLKNFITKFRGRRGGNCTTCGRLLCKECGTRESGKWCCKDGKGCRWNVQLPKSNPFSPDREIEPETSPDYDLKDEESNTSSRRLGKLNLSDSFWQGFFTSMLILLGTFVVYHLVFQKPSNHPCRKTYIKKKRSTFFKGRTSDVKPRTSVREAKCVFSKVMRRQLSKLDEN